MARKKTPKPKIHLPGEGLVFSQLEQRWIYVTACGLPLNQVKWDPHPDEATCAKCKKAAPTRRFHG